jgi:hypothetical protein
MRGMHTTIDHGLVSHADGDVQEDESPPEAQRITEIKEGNGLNRTRTAKIVLGGILLMSILGAQRLWLVNNRPVITKDGIHYLAMAKWMQASGIRESIREFRWLHPAYPLAVVGVHAIHGNNDLESWEAAATCISFATSMLAMFGVWILGWKIIGSARIGLAGALLFGLGSKVSIHGADVGNDAMALMFQVWALLAVMKAADLLNPRPLRSAAYAALAGLLAGLGYLTRPESAMVVVVAAALWMSMALRRRCAVVSALRTTGAILVTWLVLAIPYMLASESILGKWGGGYFHLASGPLLATVNAIEIGQAIIQVLGKFTEAQHPVLAALTCIYLALLLLSRLEAMKPFRHCMPRPGSSGGFIIIAILALSLPVVIWRQTVVDGSSRYLLLSAAVLTSLPAALLAGAGAMADSLIGMRQARNRLFWGGTVLLGLAITVHALRPLHSGDIYLRDAGIAIRNASSSKDITIISDSSYVLYYAQVAHPHRLGVVSNTAQPIPAEWIAMSGAAGSEELSALSLCIQQEGHEFWRDFERSPGTPGERMVRVWRKKRTQPSR